MFQALVRFLVRRQMKHLPFGFNPVYGLTILRLRRKGCSKCMAEYLALAAGLNPIRSPRYFEEEIKRNKHEYERYLETGDFSSFTNPENEKMKKALEAYRSGKKSRNDDGF